MTKVKKDFLEVGSFVRDPLREELGIGMVTYKEGIPDGKDYGYLGLGKMIPKINNKEKAPKKDYEYSVRFFQEDPIEPGRRYYGSSQLVPLEKGPR
jgi:hypothetical protein